MLEVALLSYIIIVSSTSQTFKSVISKLSNATCLCRPTWEGGQYDGDEKSRLDALHLAMELGADYIDIELKVTIRFLLLLH